MGCGEKLSQCEVLKDIVRTEINMNYNNYMSVGRRVQDQVLKAIQQDPELSVDRAVVAGSAGKGTWLGSKYKTDIDLVLMLNDPKGTAEEPFKDNLDRIEGVVKQLQQTKGTRIELLQRSKNVVTLRTWTKKNKISVEMDIVPATNLVRPGTNPPDRSLVQLERALAKMAKTDDPNVREKYSSATAEAVVKFARDQENRGGQILHDTRKLAKWWNANKVDESKLGEEKISGRSYIMEILATKAYEKAMGANYRNRRGSGWSLDGDTEKFGRCSRKSRHGFVFEKFLELVAQPADKVNVTFDLMVNKNSKAAELSQKFQDCKSKPRAIYEPTNPYNNLMDNVTDQQWQVFREAAQRSLDIIRSDRENLDHELTRDNFC